MNPTAARRSDWGALPTIWYTRARDNVSADAHAAIDELFAKRRDIAA